MSKSVVVYPDDNREARFQRLAKLFDTDSDDGYDRKSEQALDQRMDHIAAQENMDKFMSKLNNHLETEKVLIRDWDKQRRKRRY